MIAGGSTTLILLLSGFSSPLGLDPSFWGILVSAVFFYPISLLTAPSSDGKDPFGA
jgi:hypothetical protein